MHTAMTNQILNIISNENLNQTFTYIDDLVFVNLDFLTTRNYQFEGINEYFYMIGQLRQHQIVFLQRDGVNLRYTGMLETIKQTITDLDLNYESCYFYGYVDYNIKNCTFLKMDVLQMWCSIVYHSTASPPPSSPCIKYHFAGLYGRFDLYRFKLYQHLSTKNSLLSWNANQIHINQRYADIYADELQWANTNPMNSLDYDNGRNSIPAHESLTLVTTHYNDYFIEVVAETDVHTAEFFTEKTCKNFYLGKPFLLLNGQHSLKTLQDYGFKTFAPFIDESYDNCSNVFDRITRIKQEIDRLSLLSVEQLQTMHNDLQSVFEHNRQFFEKIANGKN
jgi:hypothetical protein